MSVWEIAKLDWAKQRLADNRARKLGLPLLDAVAIVLAICLALIMYHQGLVTFQRWFDFWVILGTVLILKLSVFAL